MKKAKTKGTSKTSTNEANAKYVTSKKPSSGKTKLNETNAKYTKKGGK